MRFETVLPTPPAELPRMDVAAFVGFASAGPLDTPVLVEDPAAFRELFGPAVPIAWDGASTVHSYLAGAVEAFFANGGRRAWVVRVAGRAGRTRADAPIAHGFELPGVLDGERLASVRARSEGSWCEPLAAAAFESADPLAVEAFFADAGATALGLDYAGRSGLTLRPGSTEPVAGDLCRLVFAAEGIAMFIEVDRVLTAGGRRHVLALGVPDCFNDRAPAPLAAVSSVVRSGAAGRIAWPLPSGAGETAGVFWLEYPAADLPEVHAADLLIVHLADGRSARLTITGIELGLAGGASTAGVPARVESRAVLWPIDSAAATAAVASVPTAERVELGLAVFDGDAVVSSIAGLGFCARHPRFFGLMPSDRALFLPQSSTRAKPIDPAMRALVEQPRFALAAPDNPPLRCLPLGLPPGPLHTYARATLVRGAPEDRLVRDGLATNDPAHLHAFGAELFLDDRLTAYGATALLGTAEHLLYVANLDLVGIHALVPVQDVSMISVPDAAHRAWSRGAVEPIALLDAPILENQPAGSATLIWTAVARATRYHLEVSEDADFERNELLYEGASLTRDATPADDCARLRYYRVRAENAADAGPWSNTVALRQPNTTFAPCTEWRDELPVLFIAASPPGASARLEWARAVPVVGEEWELEESEEPGFLGPSAIYSGPDTAADVPFGPEGTRYFRVRARREGVPGAWSNTVIVLTDSRRPAFVLEAPEQYAAATRGELLAVQRALLRFAAARLDTTAFLSGPRHHRAGEAADHARRLVLPGGSTGAFVTVRALTDGEQGVLSHGALIAPWVIAGPAGVLEPSPPDGVVVGSVAARTIARGAWIAPANQPLAGLLGTTHEATRAENDVAIAAAINVVEDDPRGFVLRTAYTLSSDGALVDLSVARLFHLVRRMLARLGQTYVFEPQGRPLATRVHDELRQTLVRLWSRGALAGAISSEAFEVVTSERVNDRRSRDAGRFVAEVRIAPSRPLTFLSIRLVETDLGTLGVQVS